MEKEKIEELKKLAQPLQDWLAKNYNPMCEIRVDSDGVLVLSKEVFEPIDFFNKG